MSNLETTGLVVAIEELINTFVENQRNEFVIRADSEAKAPKEYAFKKKISALKTTLTEIIKQNHEILVKSRQTTQEVQH